MTILGVATLIGRRLDRIAASAPLATVVDARAVRGRAGAACLGTRLRRTGHPRGHPPRHHTARPVCTAAARMGRTRQSDALAFGMIVRIRPTLVCARRGGMTRRLPHAPPSSRSLVSRLRSCRWPRSPRRSVNCSSIPLMVAMPAAMHACPFLVRVINLARRSVGSGRRTT